MIRCTDISYQLQHKTLLSSTSIQIDNGKLHVLLGANGAGKSTLIKLLSGLLSPTSGSIYYDEKDIASFNTIQLSKRRAVLAQSYQLHFPITVRDVVAMGCYQAKAADSSRIIDCCLSKLNIERLADRWYQTLSGGEAQKVQMARVLAQLSSGEQGASSILFLDEPVAHVDIRYQHEIMRMAQDLCREQGYTVVVVLHDINLALQYADHFWFMRAGKVIASIDTARAISEELLEDIYGIKPIIAQVGTQLMIRFEDRQ